MLTTDCQQKKTKESFFQKEIWLVNKSNLLDDAAWCSTTLQTGIIAN